MPQSPLDLGGLAGVWDAVLAAGEDITTLNQLRAATSAITGGAVLRYVRSPASLSLIMVDNAVSGARWVASGFTYDYKPSHDELTALLNRVGLVGTQLAKEILEASDQRALAMSEPIASRHENHVIAEPLMMQHCGAEEARRRHYRVVELSHVVGEVEQEVARWRDVIEREATIGDPICVIGVGEVTVRVTGTGSGGRCQEFAWRLAEVLKNQERDGVFVARASDGRDFVPGVAGAWVDGTTFAKAGAHGLDWSALARGHDSYRGLHALSQLLVGEHTGWNLCDLYVALLN